MIIDLELQENGEWFDYFQSTVDPSTGEVRYEEAVPLKDGGARVKIRSIVPFIEARMANRKMEVERVLNPKSRAMERIRFYPELSVEENLKEREDTYDYAIQDFEGFVDKRTKKPIECNKTNKMKMMKIPVFDRFVARCLQLLSESGVQEASIESKNSLTGSSSQTIVPDPE